MAKVYATLIIKGIKSLDDVPKNLKKQVKEELIDSGMNELTEDEKE